MAAILTIQINVNDPAPLDGATPLVPGTFTKTTDALGRVVFNIQAGQPFGLFDPGEQMAGNQRVGYFLVASTMISQANYVAGDEIALVSPQTSAAAVEVKDKIDLAANNGVNPMPAFLIPIDHKLGFTVAGAGPHSITLSLAIVSTAAKNIELAAPFVVQ